MLAIAGMSLVACLGEPEAPVEEELPDIFASPDMVEVRPGDSLSKIAEAQGCTVEELVAWNALETDVIEPGQILLVWESSQGDRAVPKDAADRPDRVARAPAPAPAPSWNPLRRLVAPAPAPSPAPAAPPAAPGAPEVAGVEPAPSAPTPRPSRILVRGAGILGIDLGGSNDDLEASARNMRRHDSQLDQSGLGARGEGLADGGEAGSIEVERRLDDNYGGVQIPNTPVSPPRMSRPSAKRCLAGPTEADLRGDEDMVGAQGLSSSQINAGMAKVVRASSQCFPRGTQGSYAVLAELIVGCDGIVDSVRMVSTGVVPTHVTSCITTTLGYGGFAAHAVPNGVVFQYPLKYTF